MEPPPLIGKASWIRAYQVVLIRTQPECGESVTKEVLGMCLSASLSLPHVTFFWIDWTQNSLACELACDWAACSNQQLRLQKHHQPQQEQEHHQSLHPYESYACGRPKECFVSRNNNYIQRCQLCNLKKKKHKQKHWIMPFHSLS